MDAQSTELRTIDYRGLFPWVHLFRAFRIAVDVRKILLAGMALGALSLGNRAIRSLPFAPPRTETNRDAEGPVHRTTDWTVPGHAAEINLPPLSSVSENPWSAVSAIGSNWRVVLRPVRTYLAPAVVLVRTEHTWSEAADAWLRLLWLLMVWAVFGGALTRMAAVEFARDTKISMVSALRFSTSRFFSYLSAPLLPIIGIGVLWLVGLVGGLIGRIPQIGGVLVGALWFLPLMLGFVMVLILIGLVAGWPLMYAGISTEGSDAFDGFSRSYSFVFSRPWHYLFDALVAVGYGVVVISFVTAICSLLVYLSSWAVGSGMGADAVSTLLVAGPRLSGVGTPVTTAADVSGLSAGFAAFWMSLLSLAIAGIVYSYFWTSATIIYFLLRKADDATALDEVYLPDEETEDDLLPLVGVAASRQEVIERPLETRESKQTEPDSASP